MKKQVSRFEPKHVFTGSPDSFAKYVSKNIDEIASAVGWSPVKEVLKATEVKLANETIIVQAIIHQDGIKTVLVMQIANQDGSPIEAMEYAVDEVVKQLTETGQNAAPCRFVVVGPSIREKVVKMSQERNIPISFLMVDNDRCFYWKSNSGNALKSVD
ncbi:MAG: hypothetical protein LLF93_09445 [Bacteroidales bacterium]|nr:hypothetical protein [Bacteroidales bacterium]